MPRGRRERYESRSVTGGVKADRGLDHVILGDSRISLVAGEAGDLVYRGYRIRELVPRATYEAVIHLLLFDSFPSDNPPSKLTQDLASRRELPPQVDRFVEALPLDLPPMEALRTLLSALGDGTYGYPPTVEQGLALIARTPTLLTRHVRRSQGHPPVPPRASLGHVENYLYMLTGERPNPVRTKALENYFVLLADHGMNASTFALRVVISTNSDLISAATAAIAALKGPAHGGAPSRVVDMLDAIGRSDRAEAWIEDVLARRERLYGFGHRAYKVEDPRATLLKQIARTVADPSRYHLAETVETVALAALERERPGRRLYTNVEYYGAVVLEAVGLPRELFTPTFALARTAGWVAHALEQAQDNRLIRPEVNYVGRPAGLTLPGPGT